MDELTVRIFIYVIIVLSATFHEFAHGFIAYKLGDSTAKDAGRLTLNPIAHVDIFGTVILPIFLLLSSGVFFGWAKPVPYNPFNLRDKKYGSLKVGIAGPASNFLIAIILGIVLRIMYGSGAGFISEAFLLALAFMIYINIFLALFNLIPVPPLDGSKVLVDLFPGSRNFVERLGFLGIFIALFIAFFFLSGLANLIFWVITGQRFGI